MFEGIVNFFKRIGKKEQIEASSKETAKEREHSPDRKEDGKEGQKKKWRYYVIWQQE